MKRSCSESNVCDALICAMMAKAGWRKEKEPPCNITDEKGQLEF
jgi:hypothetical protein